VSAEAVQPQQLLQRLLTPALIGGLSQKTGLQQLAAAAVPILSPVTLHCCCLLLFLRNL
jgi:hypothetical protein